MVRIKYKPDPVKNVLFATFKSDKYRGAKAFSINTPYFLSAWFVVPGFIPKTISFYDGDLKLAKHKISTQAEAQHLFAELSKRKGKSRIDEIHVEGDWLAKKTAGISIHPFTNEITIGIQNTKSKKEVDMLAQHIEAIIDAE